MYYSYVEIEYPATSFSPARTDLAPKLLTRIRHQSIFWWAQKGRWSWLVRKPSLSARWQMAQGKQPWLWQSWVRVRSFHWQSFLRGNMTSASHNRSSWRTRKATIIAARKLHGWMSRWCLPRLRRCWHLMLRRHLRTSSCSWFWTATNAIWWHQLSTRFRIWVLR